MNLITFCCASFVGVAALASFVALTVWIGMWSFGVTLPGWFIFVAGLLSATLVTLARRVPNPLVRQS